MLRILAFISAVSISTFFQTAHASQTITFSISPERNVSTLARMWVPVLNELEKSSGLSFQFKTAPNATKFTERLKRGESDVIFVDPYVFSSSLNEHFNAIAKPQVGDMKNDPLGIIVVNQKSPYERIDDLSGKSFSFSSPEAFSSSVLPRFHMQATGIKYKAVFSRSSVSSALSVSRGRLDAAGLDMSSYNALPNSLKRHLKIVWTSTPSDLCQGMKNLPFVFAVNRSLSPEVAEKLQTALLSMNESEKGRNLMKSLGFSSIQLAQSNEWRGIAPLAGKVLGE